MFHRATHQGKGWIYYGNGGKGRVHVVRQWNGGGSRFVSPLGMLDSDQRFLSAFELAIPAGRDSMIVEIEVKPVGTPFDGTGLVVGPRFNWSNSIERDTMISGLAPFSIFHWRVRGAGGRHLAYARTPWFAMADLSRTLTDFRTLCTGSTWYRDQDGDGHGTPALTQISCVQPAGYSAKPNDCDDTTAARFPGNPEVCDGLDNNCDAIVDNAAFPPGMVAMSFSKSGGLATFGWPPIFGATRYDLTRGALGTLRATVGNFTPSVNQCTANIGTGGADGDTPPAGDGFWYVVRAVNCGGGTYDDSSPTQSGARDAEIAASPLACP